MAAAEERECTLQSILTATSVARRPAAVPSGLRLFLAAAALTGAAAADSAPAVVAPQDRAIKQVQIQKRCGISRILNESSNVYRPPADILDLVCNTTMITNCSVSYHPMRCPAECAFLVPNVLFSCLLQCVPRKACTAANPNRPYPNPESFICESCHIRGCKVCESQTQCEECHDNFVRTADGTSCQFYMDDRVHWNTVMRVLGCVIGVLVVLALLWYAKHGPHLNKDINMTGILRARRHRHLTKVHHWELNHPKNMRYRYNLLDNVHDQNILGVGLPLFYNNICFMMAVAALFFVVTRVHFHLSPISRELGAINDPRSWLTNAPESPPEYKPAVILSPLSVCDRVDSLDLLALAKAFARSNFYVVGLLYVITFCLSLLFGRWQSKAAEKFDRANATMSDYALRLTGLPKDETSEPGIKEWIQEELRKALPEEQRRPDRVVHRNSTERDLTIPRASSSIEVFGVSVCYDYSDQWAEVDDVMWKEVEQMEVDMHRAAGMDSWKLDERHTTAVEKNMTFKEVEEENRQKAKAWFEEDKTKLMGSGEAFIVFRYISDAERVKDYALAHPSFLQHPNVPDRSLKLMPVHSEPNCIAWWFLGLEHGTIRRRAVSSFVKVLFLILLVQLTVILPYTCLIIVPYAATGNEASGIKMTIAGIVIGNVNGILFITNFMTALNIGFPRKDWMDLFVLFANTILVLINTSFNIFVTVMLVQNQTDLDNLLEGFFEAKTIRAIGTENAISKSLYHMMMPGSFFTGLVMAMIMAGWVPFIWNSFLMKLIYVWRCFPDCLLKVFKLFLPYSPPGLDFLPFRSAEKGFEPWEVAICGNYADQVVNPTICFIFLFFLSPYTSRIFGGMLLWAVFEYFYFRFMHLRYCKTCFYTTNRLDSFNNYLWGLPLAVIASAWSYWGIRSELFAVGWPVYLKLGVLVVAGLVSAALWLASYTVLVRPFQLFQFEDDEVEKTVEELGFETVYTWFNCNTPYVLKCKYFYKDKDGNNIDERLRGHPLACGENEDQVRYFEVGKQGLFAKPERHRLAYKLPDDWLEFETWFELGLEALDSLLRGCHGHRKEGAPFRARSVGGMTYGLLANDSDSRPEIELAT